jgi:hypothetical protein
MKVGMIRNVSVSTMNKVQINDILEDEKHSIVNKILGIMIVESFSD